MFRLVSLFIILGAVAFSTACSNSKPSDRLLNHDIIPTATADTGVVHGIVQSFDTKQPLSTDANGIDVYLAEILENEDGSLRFAGFDRKTAPVTAADENGQFVFTNVAPGAYAIVIKSPLSEVIAVQASSPDQEAEVIISAGEVVDVGTVYTRYP